MIPVSATTVDSLIQKETADQSTTWQRQIKDGFNDVATLLNHLNLNENTLPYSIDKSQAFKLKVTRHFANLMKKSDPSDPLLLQVLPLQQENDEVKGFSTDPLQESHFSPTEGVIHKYSSRALLIAHQACAVHCRYCFRRHFPYQDQRLTQSALEQAIEFIQEHCDLREIILSGGDPLSLSDEKLEILFDQLNSINHITTIRIHTRTPVMAPARITSKLVDILSKTPKKTVLVLHVNHAHELSADLAIRLRQLASIGVTLLNQTVLLKGVNDNTPALVELSNALFSDGVLPYYLHQLDRTRGTQHFLVDDNTAHRLWSELQAEVSGYLLPRLVREIPGKRSKTWINPSQNWTY